MILDRSSSLILHDRDQVVKRYCFHNPTSLLIPNFMREVAFLRSLDSNFSDRDGVNNGTSKQFVHKIIEVNERETQFSSKLYLFNFRQYIERERLSRRLSPWRKVEILRILLYRTLTGLSQIHSQLIIHGDVKPDNILLDHLHNTVLCDFDISVANFYNETCKNLEIQTSLYRAPEVIFGDRDYSSKIDIWSLGIICLHVITDGFFPESLVGNPNYDLEIFRYLGFPVNENIDDYDDDYDDNNNHNNHDNRKSNNLDNLPLYRSIKNRLRNSVSREEWMRIINKARRNSTLMKTRRRSEGNLNQDFSDYQDEDRLVGKISKMELKMSDSISDNTINIANGLKSDYSWYKPLNDLIRRMLQFDPAIRASASELLESELFHPLLNNPVRSFPGYSNYCDNRDDRDNLNDLKHGLRIAILSPSLNKLFNRRQFVDYLFDKEKNHKLDRSATFLTISIIDHFADLIESDDRNNSAIQDTIDACLILAMIFTGIDNQVVPIISNRLNYDSQVCRRVSDQVRILFSRLDYQLYFQTPILFLNIFTRSRFFRSKIRLAKSPNPQQQDASLQLLRSRKMLKLLAMEDSYLDYNGYYPEMALASLNLNNYLIDQSIFKELDHHRGRSNSREIYNELRSIIALLHNSSRSIIIQ